MDGSARTPSERTWIVGPAEIPDDRPLSPEELPTLVDLQNGLLELAPILERIGGVVAISVDRAPTSVEGVYVALRYIIRWHSFVPARSEAQPPAPPEATSENGAEEPAEEPVPQPA